MPDVLLKIRPAKLKDDDRSPKRGPLLMEQALAAIHGLHRSSARVSLEIGLLYGKVGFFARANGTYAALVESQIYGQYPGSIVERIDPGAFAPTKEEEMLTLRLKLRHPDIFPIKRHPQFDDVLNRITIDPLSSITSTLGPAPGVPGMRGHIAIGILPVSTRFRNRALRFLPLINKGFSRRWTWYRDLFTSIHLARGWRRLALLPLDLLMGGFRSWFRSATDILSPITASDAAPDERRETDVRETTRTHDREDEIQGAKDKVNRLLFLTSIRIRVIAPAGHAAEAQEKLREIASSFQQFSLPQSNHFVRSRTDASPLLSNEEIATIWHLPTILVRTPNIDWVSFRTLEPPQELPLIGGEPTATTLGEAIVHGERKRFGIRPDDRRRHVYTIGKTGMGKSTLLENMIFSDIHAGNGLAVIDPHGDLADAVLRMIPKARTNDVVLFDPTDSEYPISFNMLECRNPSQRSLTCSGLMAVFTKIWPDVWSGRMEHILRNTLLALIEGEGNSMLGIMRMYADDGFRERIVSHLTDPLVKSFWEDEYANWSEKYRTEAVAAIQNKVGQLLSTPLIRNIIGQTTSSLDMRHAMDTGKIIIANLSKGRLGEDNSNFLGSILVTKFQIDSMSRAEVPESERRDFYLYVDEFQNFATTSFAGILSEARKYRLNLTMANQYIGQLSPDRANTQLHDAVFGNVGTLVSFQIGSEDAEEIASQFGDEKLEGDIVVLPKYHAYLRLMIDGITSPPFSTVTLPPPRFEQDKGRVETIRALSRERYAKKRATVEGNIRQWAAGAKAAKAEQKQAAKAKEKELGEIGKAKKKGMKLADYRKWRDREMWTNRFNALKKKQGQGNPLSGDEQAEMDDLKRKLDAAGSATVPPTARTDR